MGVSSLSASGPALAQNEALAPHERRSPGVSSLPLVQSSEVAEGPADNMAALAPADNENTPTAKVPTSPSQRHPETTSASPSPVSVTASGPYATNIRLSPDVEEEIKNAVLEAAAHSHKDTQRTSISGRHKIKMKQHRRGPDGRRESPRTTRNWLIAKKVLRWVSLTICGLMVVGETILAIFDGAYADTALGTSLGFLLGIWDTVRLVRLRLKRDVEPVSVFHLVAEGTFTAAIIISFSCIVDQVRRYWAGQFMIRGWIFSSGMLLLEGIHITLFVRGCVDKYLHRDAVDWRRYNGWELPWYEESRPTEVVVKYVHICPKCSHEFSPDEGEHEYDKAADGKRSSKKSREKEPVGVPSIVVSER